MTHLKTMLLLCLYIEALASGRIQGIGLHRNRAANVVPAGVYGDTYFDETTDEHTWHRLIELPA